MSGVATQPAPVGATRRRRLGLRLGRGLDPLLTVLAVLVAFELLSRTEVLPSRHFPPMSDTLAELGRQLGEGDFWSAVADTMRGWAIGLGIAVALAIPIGVLVGSSTLVYRSLRVLIEFLRPIPSVALIPLAVLVFGTGTDSKVFLVAFASFWPLLIQTMYGVQDVDPIATDTARSFRISATGRLVRVTLPSALPYVATGLRIATAVALVLAVTAELVIGSSGLGSAINVARSGGAVELMYALIIATGLIGWALNLVAMRGERRLLHWHVSQRRNGGAR